VVAVPAAALAPLGWWLDTINGLLAILSLISAIILAWLQIIPKAQALLAQRRANRSKGARQ